MRSARSRCTLSSRTLGLDVERFGRTSMLVRTVPAALGTTDASALLADLAGEIAELGGPMSLRDKLDHVASHDRLPWLGARRTNPSASLK